MSYFAFFQSIYRYGLIFWGSSSRIQEILIIQKKVIRSLSNAGYNDHCKPLFAQLKIQTVINLYIFDLFSYSLNKINDQTFCNQIHPYNTRNNSNINTNYVRLSKTQKSHTMLSKKVFNKLNKTNLSKLFISKPEVCLNKFYDWLLKHPFYTVEDFFLADLIII